MNIYLFNPIHSPKQARSNFNLNFELKLKLLTCAVQSLQKVGIKQPLTFPFSRMAVGQTLQITGPTEGAPKDRYQWYQIDPRGDWFPISGATRSQVRSFTVWHTLSLVL